MKTVKLYNGTVTVKFDEEKHRYYVNGEYKPGVTTFLKVINKPALIPWAVKQTVEHVRTHLDDLTSTAFRKSVTSFLGPSTPAKGL